ncbi:TetR/AcrR family transcriptional regulator [Candidatus Enterococcus clewellii]|uniref:HTH tetR-type domain-containing protein n=1 Tax=Candidatus Enterococcus clewellii TaxID=1834193 RepID=A0A242KDZ5_9ENTE|nr:TetR/AcrR family transcriptional regulator [Enterococcus sp. 9E7_DIV0242]OTP19186.1 hypothetical protein A5888_001000 [Enterococcus sp. 9E7_DIV0242]
MIENLEADRKLSLINAGFKEFARNGYDKASTNIIAKEAEISKALMFHYVKNKEEFFLYLVGYCMNQLNKNYVEKMDFSEKDLFKRLRQSYVLQIELRKTYPWIFEFNEQSEVTKSEAVNEKLEEKAKDEKLLCYDTLFQSIDESKFREGITLKRYKELIFWGNIGFTEQLLLKIRGTDRDSIDYGEVIEEIDTYFDDLSSVYYKENYEQS